MAPAVKVVGPVACVLVGCISCVLVAMIWVVS